MTLHLQDDGFLAKILVAAGAKDVKVGTPLAVLVGEHSSLVTNIHATPCKSCNY